MAPHPFDGSCHPLLRSYVGETTPVTAAFRSPEGDPIYGADATFSTGDPAVLRVTPVAGVPALAAVEFLAVGTTALTVCSIGEPPVCSSVDLEVVPVTAED